MNVTIPEVASIFPMERRLEKWTFYPRKVWMTPPVAKGAPPVRIQFTDQHERVYRGSDGRWNPTYSEELIKGQEIAENFVAENTRFAIGQKNGGYPGIWMVGSLGGEETITVQAASNSPNVAIRVAKPHNVKAPMNLVISGGNQFWSILNGMWPAQPVDDLTLSLPIDSSRLGDYYASGSALQIHVKQPLSLDEEAAIMGKKQAIFCQQWVDDADRWAEKKRYDRIIPMHQTCVDWLGLTREWRHREKAATEMAAQIQCPYCHGQIAPDVPKCPLCKEIANPVLYARLQHQEREAMTQENERLKAERKERERLAKEELAKV